MPLITASHDSLPYIEPAAPSHIAALIAAELDAAHTTTPHPSLPPLRAPNFTPAISLELERVAANLPLTGGVDVARYTPSPDADADAQQLQAAYTALTHLGTRLANLSLLSAHGKNAWLVHNASLEALLKAHEEALMALRTQVELVNKARKAAQVAAAPEIERLEERWRKAVGRVLEVEVAIEALRREAVERQRGK
ncbi:Pre-mRNA-splicing factor SPF27 [Sphaerosporella brunnea]|uniref:Pre-mRNA-splicing factor SPF27 n=1 Tax=Sphaerosporella brunnea TaxID=1250544 RepID=A0A5J5ETV0_9PEZI|nr:Pre-mRNA-splicing factor SPF27 [Sphaerosporella brunnea]